MKRVLFVMYNALDKGGTQNVMINIVRTLHADFKFDALVLSDKDGFFDSEFLSYGGKLFKKSFCCGKSTFLNRFQFYLRGNSIYRIVKKTIKENGPYDVIHCHNADEAGIAVRAAKRCGVPIRIAHAHTAFDSNYNLLARIYIRLLRKRIYQNATDLVACSEKAGVKLFANRRFRLIYNTVDEKFLHNETPSGSVPDALVLLQVGTICDNKNQMFSVRVLLELQKKYPDTKLVFIGASKGAVSEEYYKKLVEKCKQSGITDAVSFLPATTDVKNEMNKCTYTLFPSRYEGLGIVPIESQALGVKCFLSSTVPCDVDCGGCIFLELKSGEKTWANSIAELFESDHGERKKYDILRFKPDVIMDQYRKLYSGELNEEK